MVKNDRSCLELKPHLQKACKNLLCYLEKKEYPPAEACRDAQLLLLEYLESLTRTVPDFAAQHGIRVSFADVQEEKVTAQELASGLQRNPELLDLLYRLALRKIIAGNDSCVSAPGWQTLLKQRYVIPVSIEIAEKKQEYYALSSKGWSCLNRKNIQKTIKKQAGERFCAIPDKMMLKTEDCSPLNYIREAMLEKFYADKEENFLSFLYPDTQGLLLGTAISAEETVRYSCPAIFDGEISDAQLTLMRELSDSDQVDEIIFLSASAEEKLQLQQTLGRKETEKIHFCVTEEADGSKI